MRSFRRKPSNRRAVYLELAGAIESQLRDAYAKRSEQDGMTQSSLAKKLGINRSAIHRRLGGLTNMTILSIAEMVWALGYCIKITIYDPDEVATNQTNVRPDWPDQIEHFEGSEEAQFSGTENYFNLKPQTRGAVASAYAS